MSTDEHMAYIGRCAECRGIVAAYVDDPKHRRGKDGSARFVADLMRYGKIIERVTCQFVRDNMSGCTEGCSCKMCQRERHINAPTLRMELLPFTDAEGRPHA
jgi:hypothetical protein